MQSLYLTGNTLRPCNKAKPVSAVWGNNRCLLWEPYGTHRYTVRAEFRVCTSEETYYVSDTKPNRLMLFGETVAVYCENPTEDTDTLCGQNVEILPHRKHNNSPLKCPTAWCCLGKSSLFILRTIRNNRYSVWAECRVCTSEETYYVSATKPQRLMLFGETVALYCENHKEHTDTLCAQNIEIVPQMIHNTSPLQRPTG
jgi:hypothetical protein